MVHFPKSYSFGKAKELNLLPTLSNYFKREIKPYPNQYDKHDFYDDEYNYEVKSRTNKYKDYSTTMITANKISGEKKLVFIFNFTDGCYYIEYDKDKFKNYSSQMFSRAGYKWDEKAHIYIPIEDLTKIDF